MPNLRLWLRAEWDRVLGTTLIAVGAVLLVVTYQGVANSRFVADQASYLASGGLGGLFLLAVGAMLRIQADLHDEWRKLDRIEAAMRGEPLPDPTELLDLAGAGSNGSAGGSRTPGGAAQSRLVGHAPVMAINWREDGLRRALALSGAVLLAPLAVMSLGWRAANQTTSLNTAAGGVGIAILGLAGALAVVGLYTFWIRAKTVSRKDRLFGVQLLMEQLAERRRHQPRPAAVAVSCDDTEVLIATGSHRFHRPGCASLAGLETTAIDRRSVDAGLAPCGLCGAR